VSIFIGTMNFKPTDRGIACACGCGMLPEQDFMERVQRARDRTRFPWSVNRAASCPAHNAKVSSTGLDGPHTTGRAIDIGVRGAQALAVLSAMLAEGFTGIGVSQKGASRFVHGDDLPNSAADARPTLWSY